jgi:glycosyltransferase involved in cell wall biosynthesis
VSSARAVILYLGRPGSMGERRRVASWSEMLTAAGADVDAIALLAHHPAGRFPPRTSDLRHVWRGSSVPEVLAWSPSSVAKLLQRLRPNVLVCVSARAYHPMLIAHADTTVLDFVDSLARSYRDRGQLSHGWRRAGFAALSWSHSRFERRSAIRGLRRVAAGWRDAADLGAEWLPILAPSSPSIEAAATTRDIVFFGNLCYPPNVAAVRRLSRLWPALERRRPGTTALLAGATPTAEVRKLARLHGWKLVADFADLHQTCGQARVAVAPLDHTAGIQIKVLEAAAMGIAQVVSPAALEGMAPGFPAMVSSDDVSFIDAICTLLDDDTLRHNLAQAAAIHVRDHYSVQKWRPWGLALIDHPRAAAEFGAPVNGFTAPGAAPWSAGSTIHVTTRDAEPRDPLASRAATP